MSYPNVILLINRVTFLRHATPYLCPNLVYTFAEFTGTSQEFGALFRPIAALGQPSQCCSCNIVLESSWGWRENRKATSKPIGVLIASFKRASKAITSNHRTSAVRSCDRRRRSGPQQVGGAGCKCAPVAHDAHRCERKLPGELPGNTRLVFIHPV